MQSRSKWEALSGVGWRHGRGKTQTKTRLTGRVLHVMFWCAGCAKTEIAICSVKKKLVHKPPLDGGQNRVLLNVATADLTVDINVKRNSDKRDDCLTVVDSSSTPTQLCVFLFVCFLQLQIRWEFSVVLNLNLSVRSLNSFFFFYTPWPEQDEQNFMLLQMFLENNSLHQETENFFPPPPK